MLAKGTFFLKEILLLYRKLFFHDFLIKTVYKNNFYNYIYLVLASSSITVKMLQAKAKHKARCKRKAHFQTYSKCVILS